MYWYKKVWQQYTDFGGRARRREYWTFTLFNLVISLVLGILSALTSQITGSDPNESLTLFDIIAALYGLAAFIPGLAVGIRRLHDTGRSGWWLLIGLIPLLGSLALLVFYVQEGKAMDNQYGSNPKDSPSY